jgi:hypothetical protein
VEALTGDTTALALLLLVNTMCFEFLPDLVLEFEIEVEESAAYGLEALILETKRA